MQKFYQAQIDQNNKLADSLQYKIDNLLNRRYLYTINFAANNTDQNIAPYLALTRVFDANLSLLDSIAVKMTPQVKGSKYGMEFINFLEKRREQED
jgi:N-acetylglutamate synthase-like GNAT family acetyltransferase